MKGRVVATIPHPFGPSPKPAGWTPQGTDHYGNEKAWHAIRSERTDRTHIEKDMSLGILAEIDRLHPVGKGGTGLAEWPGLRPMRHRVWGRRRDAWASAKAAGLAIPEMLDRPDSQRRGMLYDVLAVGEGVTSVRVGDCVVVNHCVAADRGDTLGTGVYEFSCDVDYVEPRTHETEREKLPDGTWRTYQRRMSDTERRSCGDVLAVVDG